MTLAFWAGTHVVANGGDGWGLTSSFSPLVPADRCALANARQKQITRDMVGCGCESYIAFDDRVGALTGRLLGFIYDYRAILARRLKASPRVAGYVVTSQRAAAGESRQQAQAGRTALVAQSYGVSARLRLFAGAHAAYYGRRHHWRERISIGGRLFIYGRWAW